jgi:hypothetical protein
MPTHHYRDILIPRTQAKRISMPNNPRHRSAAEISKDLALATEQLVALSETPSSSTELVDASGLGADELKKDLAKRHATLSKAATLRPFKKNSKSP